MGRKALSPESLLVSDGLACFVATGGLENHHEQVVVGELKGSELACFQWVNTLLGKLKSAIQGTYHGFKFHIYAQRYLGDV